MWHLKAAKQLGLNTVLTVHVPANICMRGTMLYEGHVACDGQVLPERCAPCWLQSKGLPPAIARSLASLPQSLAPLARIPRLGPALTARSLVAGRQEALQDMFAAADRIIAVCGWLRDALLVNGVPPEKLILNRQGVANGTNIGASKRVHSAGDVLRFGFLGRWDPVKGVHVLVEAFRRLPRNFPVELHILAVTADADSLKYRDAVRRAASGDTRINFVPEAPNLGSGEFLATIDALLVPSQWLETGPLVVLEAFSAGKPVIGSDLGGIKELIRHERDGLLVSHADVNAWTEAMLRLSSDQGLIERLGRGIGPVRTMSDVVREMETLYREIVEVKVDAA
jgi:glycosyltransferase involved in cell wall biosynthesis